MSDRKYPLGYAVVPGAKTEEELKAFNLGGCDAIVIHAISYSEEDGQRREEVVSLDGRTGRPLNGTELFTSWCMFTSMLVDSKLLEAHSAALSLVESVKEAIRKLF